MKKTLFVILLFVAFAFPRAGAQEAAPLTDQQLRTMDAFHLVSPDDIYTWAAEFLKDEYRGRRSGDVGYDMAAEYARNLFREWGMKPGGDEGTYYNTFPMHYNDVHGVGHLKAWYRVGKDTIVKSYAARSEFFPTALSDNGEVEGELVYAGYGITAPELNYDDFRGMDLHGKIVLIEGTYPYKGKNLDTLRMWSKYQRAIPKIEAAAAAGASGVLYVSKYASPFPMQKHGPVVAFISENTADELLAGTGRSRKEWRARADAFKGRPVATGNVVSVAAETTFFPNRTTANVVGVIEGSDPVLKNEYIILGAHIDHLGMLPEMYPGALDNVSGSVIIIAAAKAMALSKADMKRSVIVVLFAAEELGVLGAEHFIATMPFPKEKITCMINIDMLGTGKGFLMHGAEEWKEEFMPYFREASEEWTRRPFRESSPKWEFKTRYYTDGNAFYNLRVPTFELKGADGVWPAPYHVPEDTMTQLDPVIMADASRVLAISIINIANK